MRQGGYESCHWDNSTDGDINYQSASSTMDSQSDELNLKKVMYRSGSEGRICPEQSIIEPNFTNNKNTTNNTESNFLELQSNAAQMHRRISNCSDISSLVDSVSRKSSESDSKTPDGTSMNTAKFDDIIEKIIELKFSQNDVKKHGDVNKNYEVYLDGIKVKLDKKKEEEEVEDGDDELRARGPLRPQPNQLRNKPYHTLDDWLENSTEMQTYAEDIDATDIQEILNNRKYCEILIPCLDRLEKPGQNCPNISSNRCFTVNNQYCGNNLINSDNRSSIPSITVSENSLASEELLMLGLKDFQSAQSDIASNANHLSAVSPELWPDSPASLTSYNVLSSSPHSRTSSRAESPGSSACIGSPLALTSHNGSPSEPLHRLNLFRVPAAYSSPTSSNHSSVDTESPSNYCNSVDLRLEDQLGSRFGNFTTWYENCESSGTMMNSTKNMHDNLDMLDEVIKDAMPELEEAQVVPKYFSQEGHKTPLWKCRIKNKLAARQNALINNGSSNFSMNQNSTLELENTASIITTQNHLVSSDPNDVYRISFQNNKQMTNRINENLLSSSEDSLNFTADLENFLSSNHSEKIGENQYHGLRNSSSQEYNNFQHDLQNLQTQIATPSTSVQARYLNKSWNESPNTPFNNFQVPETVSSFRYSRSKRHSVKLNTLWSSLNLPPTEASRKLMESLNPNNVMKAMKSLLKKSTHDLTMVDQDGDTLLMCLVSNPIELQKKKAYLVPLVERLGTVRDALCRINKYGEDALYLAAINCPQIAYVTGYLGAVMLQKGIDISQRLYQRRGDTLIHAVAANGDSHIHVLSELLALKTNQKNAVFDLSKCNYDGKTPLHVAVESHDVSGSRVSSIETIKLLLEYEADPKIKESKWGNTALHLAVSLRCDPALIQALLTAKGQEAVNIPNRNNDTPLHMAATLSDRIPLEKQKEICQHLIKAGGSTNFQNHHGQTPLALVSPERKEEIKKIFRNRKNNNDRM